MNENRELKILAVEEQNYEKAANFRDKEKTAALELNEYRPLSPELMQKHSIFLKVRGF